MNRRELVLTLMGGREPVYTIRLPYLPPAQPNASYKGTNPWVMAAIRRKLKERCRQDVTALLLEEGWQKGTPPFKTAEILVTFYLPSRIKRDHDNLVAAMKPIYDALHPDEENPDGVILDDHLGIIGIPLYDWVYRPGLSQTVIEIWDTTPPGLM